MIAKKIYILMFSLMVLSCQGNSKLDNQSNKKQDDMEIIPEKLYNVSVIRKFAHDSLAFTQGLEIYNGYLYESTGQLGQSSIRKVDLQTGKVLQKKDIPFRYFGEGITIFDNKLYYFTWQNKIGWTFDIESFEQLSTFTYDTEGWGLTHNNKYLIMSDGSNILQYKDKDKFATAKTIDVYYQDKPLKMLNEIEYVDGDIFANIWGQDQIAVIDEKSGKVKTLIDLSFLRNELDNSRLAEVLNGIAYNPTTHTFIVTGKNWPYYFELKIN